jgi:hypothetical protein
MQDEGLTGRSVENPSSLWLSPHRTRHPTAWLRDLAPNAAGDSIYVGLDGQPLAGAAAISGFPPGAWAWRSELVETGQPATFVVGCAGYFTHPPRCRRFSTRNSPD